MTEIEAFDPDFLDETVTSETQHASLVGITPVNHKLDIYRKHISAIGVMTTSGIEDTSLIESNDNGDIFLQIVQRRLLNIIQPFDGNNACSVVVMDNASIHHVDTVVELITAAEALVRFLPPYSLELNPIEEVFSKRFEGE